MVAKTAGPFSIFPRFGFTPGQRMESSSLTPHPERPDEDWYIPYNGPFEPPKNVSIPEQLEDSLGYHVSKDGVQAFLNDPQLLDRYGDVSVRSTGKVGLGSPPAQSPRFLGNRFRSELTRHTAYSSSVIDPALLHPHPRQSQASIPRLQLLPHISTDASGNVGESPMPIQRTTMPTPQKRTSWFFGLGTNKKPRRRSVSTPVSPVTRTIMPGRLPSSMQHDVIQDNVRFAKHINSSPVDDHFDSRFSTIPPPSHSSHTHHHYQPSVDHTNRSPSKRHPPRYLDQHGTPDKDSAFSSSPMNHNCPNIFSAYPYTNTTSSVSLQLTRPTASGSGLRTATSRRSHQGQDSGSFFSHNPTHRGRTLTYAVDPRVHHATHTPHLKSSISTPNLSEVARGKQPVQLRKKSPQPITGIDRWLSAETWCDALFFPRPRLKLRGLHEPHGGNSRRIVSPPVTPVSEGAPPRLNPLLGGRPRLLSAASHDAPRARVWLRSKSTTPGRPRTAPTPQRLPDPEVVPEISLEESGPVSAKLAVTQNGVCPSSPVPSLTQVLEEGEALAEQRKQWQSQASRSLGNSQTRSLSRARTKSLSRSHGRLGHKPEGSTALEFLAARTLLGGQSIPPTIAVAHTSHSRSYSNSYATSETRSRSNSFSFSHSHSHSLGNTSSQNSTRHTRNGSWNKSSLIKACAPCGDRSNLCGSPVDDRTLAQEHRTEGDHGCDDEEIVIIKGISPVPSTQSGEGVGIALSSPPSTDHSRAAHGLEDTDMSDHPYATGAIHTRYCNPSCAGQNIAQRVHKVSDYAGPHPSAYDHQLPPTIVTSDMSLRHRLPPRAVQPGTISHPYASAFSEPMSSHVRQPSNSIFPPPPVPPSVVQEGKDFTSNHHISISSPDFEKYGVGEALVFAAPSRDEQDSDPEDQPLGAVIPPQQGTLDRIVEVVKVRDLATPSKLPKSSRSRPPSVTLIVSTRSPSPTAIEGRDSNPQLSPTTNISSAHLVISALDNNDDLDEFQDLFYRPPQCGDKHKEASDTSRGIPSDIHTSYSGSALTNLVRSLSEEMEELNMTVSDASLEQESAGLSAPCSEELSQSYVFMDISPSPSLSPGSTGTPAVLRLPAHHYDAPFESGVPEDIASSRASSPLITDENDTFGHPIRQGLVDAVGISTILQCPSRATSTHPEVQDDAEETVVISPNSFIDSQLRSPDGARSSYMTSASEYSRMSGLSDFPAPPARPDLAHARAAIPEVSDVPSTPQLQQLKDPELGYPRSGHRVLSLDSHPIAFGESGDVGHDTGCMN